MPLLGTLTKGTPPMDIPALLEHANPHLIAHMIEHPIANYPQGTLLQLNQSLATIHVDLNSHPSYISADLLLHHAALAILAADPDPPPTIP